MSYNEFAYFAFFSWIIIVLWWINSFNDSLIINLVIQWWSYNELTLLLYNGLCYWLLHSLFPVLIELFLFSLSYNKFIYLIIFLFLVLIVFQTMNLNIQLFLKGLILLSQFLVSDYFWLHFLMFHYILVCFMIFLCHWLHLVI